MVTLRIVTVMRTTALADVVMMNSQSLRPSSQIEHVVLLVLTRKNPAKMRGLLLSQKDRLREHALEPCYRAACRDYAALLGY